jgi:hypothetical protein
MWGGWKVPLLIKIGLKLVEKRLGRVILGEFFFCSGGAFLFMWVIDGCFENNGG